MKRYAYVKTLSLRKLIFKVEHVSPFCIMILNVLLNFMFLHFSGDTFMYKSKDVHLNFWQLRRNFNKRKLIRLMSSRCFKKPLRFEMKRNEECYKFVNILSCSGRAAMHIDTFIMKFFPGVQLLRWTVFNLYRKVSLESATIFKSIRNLESLHNGLFSSKNGHLGFLAKLEFHILGAFYGKPWSLRF